MKRLLSMALCIALLASAVLVVLPTASAAGAELLFTVSAKNCGASYPADAAKLKNVKEDGKEALRVVPNQDAADTSKTIVLDFYNQGIDPAALEGATHMTVDYKYVVGEERAAGDKMKVLFMPHSGALTAWVTKTSTTSIKENTWDSVIFNLGEFKDRLDVASGAKLQQFHLSVFGDGVAIESFSDDEMMYVGDIRFWKGDPASALAGDTQEPIEEEPEVEEAPYVFPFTDISDTAWYRADVETAHKNGLVSGKTETTFVPGDNMTVAEAVKLAACMHQLYNDKAVTLVNGVAPAKWYSTYMSYALEKKIIAEDFSDRANEKITRRDFVKIFYASLPEGEYSRKNRVSDGLIPDVAMTDEGAEEIYTFYRAGILTGSDTTGIFNPESNIVRSEVAAILTRMFDEGARKSITLASSEEAPEYLVNTLHLLENEKKLTVGYFGGSVTVGSGSSNAEKKSWRALTREWLRAEFHDAEITERNGAIGGTGSLFGVYRADSHYIQDKAPDLNFIEMSINDNYDGTYNTDENYVYVETIVRKIYASNPKADIVFIVTGDNGTLKEDALSGKITYGEPYIKLGEYYNIPVIHVGHEVAKVVLEENEGEWPASDDGIWRNYFTDIVHPKDEGYEIYANKIIDTLTPYLLAGYVPAAEEYKDAVLPEKYYCTVKKRESGAITVDKMLTANMISPATFNEDYMGDYLIGSDEGVLTPAISNKAGEKIKLEFSASNIGIWTWSYGSNGGTNIRYSIDGGTKKTLNLYRAFPNYKVYTLATGLDNTKTHTIEIEHTDANNPFKFYGIFVWQGTNGEPADAKLYGAPEGSAGDTEENTGTDSVSGEALSAKPIDVKITTAGERDQRCTFTEARVEDASGKKKTVQQILPANVDGCIYPAWFASEEEKNEQIDADYAHRVMKIVYYTEKAGEKEPMLATYTHDGSAMKGRGLATLVDSEAAKEKTWNVAYFELDGLGSSEYLYAVQFGMYGDDPAKNHIDEEIYVGYMGLFVTLEDAKAHKSSFEG